MERIVNAIVFWVIVIVVAVAVIGLVGPGFQGDPQGRDDYTFDPPGLEPR